MKEQLVTAGLRSDFRAFVFYHFFAVIGENSVSIPVKMIKVVLAAL